MAASAVSDSDSIAPSEFPLSSSDDDLLDKTSIVEEKCPLCRSLKKYFFCSDCIRNGDFYFTHCVQNDTSQRYIEKKLALLKVKGEIQELIKLSEKCLGRKNRQEILGQEIKNIQERIKVLQKWKEETRQSIATRKSILCDVKQQKQRRLDMLLQLNSSTIKVKKHLADNSLKNNNISQDLELTRSELKEVIRENVTQLVKYIFPITWEGLNSEEDSESLATVKDALADASQTAYVRGQWIYADTGYNGQYRITGVCLPGTGDVASYQLCVNQASKNGDMEPLGHFKVALSHITQLSHLLSFYLGVRLPKKLNYLDFMRGDLNSKRFAGRVSRLHANILFLCASQAVDPVHLRHANPLARLLALTKFNICDLGR